MDVGFQGNDQKMRLQKLVPGFVRYIKCENINWKKISIFKPAPQYREPQKKMSHFRFSENTHKHFTKKAISSMSQRTHTNRGPNFMCLERG